MKSILIISIVFIYQFGNCQLNKANLELGFKPQSRKFDDRQTNQFKHLKLYYIKGKPSLEKEVRGIVGNYMNLETALKYKKIAIKEISKEGTVNSLLFHNLSKDTILVQLGDVVKGGKQDRVIEHDALILPGEKKILSVYCVEHGRWDSRSDRSRSGASFQSYHSSINSDIKKSIVKEKNQSRVWSKVAEKNVLNATETSSGTYTAMSSNANYNKDMNAYLANFLADIEKDRDIVGVLAVTGDRIIGCEIYASSKLLKANIRNVLNSFISEALLNGSEVKIQDKKVYDYLSDLTDNEEKQEQMLKDNGKSLKHNGKKVKLSSF